MQAASGAADEFTAFYLSHRDAVVATVRPIVGAEAEDVAQDAFLELFRRWTSVSTYDAPVAWVRRVAIRAAVRRRDRSRAREMLELRAAEVQAVEGVQSEFSLALASIPARDREALLLRHVLDRPIAVLADHVETTEGPYASAFSVPADERSRESPACAGLGSWRNLGSATPSRATCDRSDTRPPSKALWTTSPGSAM